MAMKAAAASSITCRANLDQRNIFMHDRRMIPLGAQRLAVPALAVAIIATASIGATYASTTSPGAKACETTKGNLVLASSKGKCPKHTVKVSLGKTGPRGAKGATGPSAAYVNADTSGGYTGGSNVTAFSALPTGSYVITATFQGFNSSTDPVLGGCQLLLHNKGSQELAFLDVPPAVDEGGGVSIAGRASSTIVVAASVTDATGHDVSVNCGDIGVFYYWSVSAQLVGSLTATGNSGF
jgi:hypothetical protein